MDLEGNGLIMCFGRRTGYGGYGDWARGGRQVLLHENVSKRPVETWIRLENETVSGRVTLNSSFGRDLYVESGSHGTRRISPWKHFLSVYICILLLISLKQI